LEQLSNPNLLLNQQAKAALPDDLLVFLQDCFVNAIHSTFFLGMLFILGGIVVAIFMGKAKYVKAEAE
jgi:hypothetical protein